jgi:hypothetical protein
MTYILSGQQRLELHLLEIGGLGDTGLTRASNWTHAQAGLRFTGRDKSGQTPFTAL